MRIIKHVLMIILILLILFPMFWIVATSVRRDNAAFSTKLFSSRYTFQYYKDLLLNRKNIPQQISELKKMINLSSEYSQMNPEELLNQLNKTEAELKRQMDLSKQQIAKSEKYVDEVVAFARERTDEMVQQFNALKEEEKQFFENRLQDIYESSEQFQLELTYEFIQSIEQVNPEQSRYYSQIISRHSPEFINAYQEIGQSLDSYTTFIEEEYQSWFQKAEGSLDQSIKNELDTIQSDFLSLITPDEFSYSKWNREINLKGYRGITGDLESVLSQENFEAWEQLTELFKATAREIDDKLSDYETRKEAILNDLEKQMAERSEIVEEYLTAEVERKKAYDAIRRMENQIEKDKQAMMGFEERMSLLDQKIQVSVYEISELKELISVELKKANEFSGSSRDEAAVQGVIGELAKIYHKIKEMGEPPSSGDHLNALSQNLNWFLTNENELVQSSGSESLKNAMDILKSQTNPVINDLEDYSILIQSYREAQAKIQENENLLEEQRIILDEKQAQTQELMAKYEEVMTDRRKIDKAKRMISLLTELERTGDYDDLSQYSALAAKFVSEFGLIDNPAKDLLAKISSLDKLVYLDRNYDVETTYLKETVDEIERVLAQFDEKKKSYVNLIYANVMIKSSELNTIENLQKAAYNRFSSELNRIARIASDLSELDEYQEISGSLEQIDKNIFESLQFWTKKPEQQFMRWLINTIILAVATAGITVMICALGAYPFSRLRFKGRKYGLLFLLLIQMFPIVMGMVALYLLLRFIGQFLPGFGLDSLWGLGLIYLGNIAFNMWLLKGYFDTIPDSLEEAAMIDGSTRFQTFWKIVLPLTAPMLAVVFLIVFMANFNEFVLASVVLQSPENYTFAVGLQSFSYGPYQMEWGLFTAAALIGAIPMVILSL